LPARLRLRAVASIRALWRRWRWPFTFAVAAAAFVAGFYGYSHVYIYKGSLTATVHASGVHLALPDRLYYTILLFKFSTGLAPPYPATLELARWLAAVVTAYAAFRALAALSQDRWARWRSRHLLRDHVVVCGLGRCGLRLAVADWERPVVAIDRSPSVREVEMCRNSHVTLLVGEATDPAMLVQAGVGRAKELIVVCGDDGVNAEVALQAKGVLEARSSPLTCHVHVDDERACALLEQAALSDPGKRPIDFEFFNVYRSGPMALLDSHGGSLAEGGEPVTLVIAGSSRLSLNLAAEAVRRWSINGDNPQRMLIFLVALDAVERCGELGRRLPDLEAFCDLQPCPADPADLDTVPPEIADLSGATGRTTAFVCLEDDSAGLRATLSLRGALADDIPIVLCTTGHSDIARLLRLAGSDALTNVTGFSLLGEVCRPAILSNGDLEVLAQAIHAQYVLEEHRRGEHPADDPSLRPWSELAEVLRESNRAQARDIGNKLAHLGLGLARNSRWGPPSFSFSAPQLDLLSTMEHERWMAERLAAGWKLGPVRDVVNKLHPSLKPWDDLSDMDKDRDRATVRDLPMFLARTGYAIVARRRATTVLPLLDPALDDDPNGAPADSQAAGELSESTGTRAES
jgi:hypothetical protein